MKEAIQIGRKDGDIAIKEVHRVFQDLHVEDAFVMKVMFTLRVMIIVTFRHHLFQLQHYQLRLLPKQRRPPLVGKHQQNI